jgi:hypothetical protein
VHGKPGFGNGPRETDELRRHTRKFVQAPRPCDRRDARRRPRRTPRRRNRQGVSPC